MKRCTRCGEEKLREEFGSAGYCKPCNRARVREWRQADPQRSNNSIRASKMKKPEKYRALNLEAYHRRMERDPEAIRLNRRNWQKTPKGVLSYRLRGHRRRGAKTDPIYAAILYNDPCSYCGASPVEIDHIIPLASQGNGEWDNLTAACRSCNASKNDRDLLRFLSERICA